MVGHYRQQFIPIFSITTEVVDNCFSWCANSTETNWLVIGKSKRSKTLKHVRDICDSVKI